LNSEPFHFHRGDRVAAIPTLATPLLNWLAIGCSPDRYDQPLDFVLAPFESALPSGIDTCSRQPNRSALDHDLRQFPIEMMMNEYLP
jgi:hypothetical protein